MIVDSNRMMRQTSNDWQDKKKLLQKVQSDDRHKSVRPILNQASSYLSKFDQDGSKVRKKPSGAPSMIVRDMQSEHPQVVNVTGPIEVKFQKL
jgi:DNA repair exonuclease SbcCD ATPase subunit